MTDRIGRGTGNSLMPDAWCLSPVSRRACMPFVSPAQVGAVRAAARFLTSLLLAAMHGSLRSLGASR